MVGTPDLKVRPKKKKNWKKNLTERTSGSRKNGIAETSARRDEPYRREARERVEETKVQPIKGE